MASRSRKRRRRNGSGSASHALVPALPALVAVMALGGAGYWWWQQPSRPAPATEAPAEVRKKKPAEPVAPATPAEDPSRFEFYELLPDQEVDVDTGPDGPPGTPPPPLRGPGVYVIQAGSFPGFAEADAVKARLALLGIESTLQTITVDGRTFHRVRIGPIEDPVALNRIRSRLQANKLEHLVVQVTD